LNNYLKLQGVLEIVIALILIVSIVVLIGVYNWGKGNGYSQYQKENNAKIQELDAQEKSLQTWAEDLSRREGNLNNTEQTINNCYSNLQNLTQEYGACKQKLDNPDSYIFNLNYSYNEINVILILFFLYIPISFTLFKFIIKDRDLRIFFNVIAFIVLLGIIVVMGIE